MFANFIKKVRTANEREKMKITVYIFFCYRYVEGGMGSVSLAISKAAEEAGAHIVRNAEVCLFVILLLFFLIAFILKTRFHV